tara:strand:+ start:2770 stop:2988 length:219 start_codon:yes stop_codon:yes gene_type:complete
MKYKQLLDLEWAIDSNTVKAQTKYDDRYQEYGTGDVLTRLAYDDLKLLREAKKTLKQAIRLLRDNDLYGYED